VQVTKQQEFNSNFEIAPLYMNAPNDELQLIAIQSTQEIVPAAQFTEHALLS
jgi:hypothetical protein